MNATRAQLKSQYKRAKNLLWVEHFREAANTITAGYFDTADLMGIASRETNLDPKWLTKAGDRGHGFGLMQIDKRSFPEFTKSNRWQDARQGILYGARVLMQKWADVEGNAGKRLTVTNSKTGKRYAFTSPRVSGAIAQTVTIAAYNGGRWAMYGYANGGDPDKYTTGKDYSSDVMARARVFRELLAADGMLDLPFSTAAAARPSEKQGAAHDDAASATATQTADTPPSIIPAPTEAIPVQTVATPSDPTPDPPKQEDTLVKIGNRFNALWTAAGATIVAAGTWLTSTPTGIAVGIIGAVVIVGIGYMAINALRANGKEKRDAEERAAREARDLAAKLERERRDHEVQLALIAAAKDKNSNTVVLVPPPVELPNADSQG